MNNIQTPNAKLILGIDLGTTNSLVAVVRDGKAEVLPVNGSRLLPSVVHFSPEGFKVGREARGSKFSDPLNTIYSVKRLLGKGEKDLDADFEKLPYPVSGDSGSLRVHTQSQSYTPVEISALILKELKLGAEKELGQPVSQAVVTVPAYFNDAQRHETRQAGRLAGLDVLRIINEPTAAALAFGVHQKYSDGVIAVYDLGGGTFDISILRVKDGIFEVLSTSGDPELGGDDLDRAVVTEVQKEILKTFGVDLYLHPAILAAALIEAERIKILFSTVQDAEFYLKIAEHQEYRKQWDRSAFESLVTPVIARTQKPCARALADAGLTAENLSEVILVGGPTRLPLVQKFVEQIFGKTPNVSMHPDEVVALGAAIQGDILSGRNRDLLLLDVVPLSLGIETYGGVMSVLIPRNTRIPTVAKEVFSTFADQQTGVDIHVLQGERDRVEANRSLAKFILKGISPAPAGYPRIEVSFLVDADGILQVHAKDLRTGKEQGIEVRPSFGLSITDTEKMLEESIVNAAADLSYRQWVEIRNQADSLLGIVDKNWTRAQSLLPEAEIQLIAQKRDFLKTQLALGQSVEDTRAALDDLGVSTQRLAEKLMVDTLKNL